jgi:hypothetical protein
MTILTSDGLIVVSSLPYPLCGWLNQFLRGQDLYTARDPEYAGYLIDIEAIEFMFQSAGISAYNPLPN